MSFFPSGVSQTTISGNTDTKVTTPAIANVSCPLAATEYSYALPTGTRYFRLRNRDGSRVQLAFVSGDSGTLYLTVYPGETYVSPLFPLDSSTTVYFRCYKATTTVEVESWS